MCRGTYYIRVFAFLLVVPFFRRLRRVMYYPPFIVMENQINYRSSVYTYILVFANKCNPICRIISAIRRETGSKKTDHLRQ